MKHAAVRFDVYFNEKDLHNRGALDTALDKRRGAALDETGRARLWLAEAARIVLANGLGLLGVTAPDRL